MVNNDVKTFCEKLKCDKVFGKKYYNRYSKYETVDNILKHYPGSVYLVDENIVSYKKANSDVNAIFLKIRGDEYIPINDKEERNRIKGLLSSCPKNNCKIIDGWKKLNLQERDDYNFYKNRIDGYKAQDKRSNRYDPDKSADIYYLMKLWREGNGECFYCKTKLTKDKIQDNRLTYDRDDETTGHNKDNLVLSCLFCNCKSVLFTKEQSDEYKQIVQEIGMHNLNYNEKNEKFETDHWKQFEHDECINTISKLRRASNWGIERTVYYAISIVMKIGPLNKLKES